MQSPDEKTQMCWSCKKQPATAKYTLAGRTEMVCATCLDRLEMQEEYGYNFRDIILPLERNEQYDEALAWVDAFLEANRHRDHDKWLARNIASTRADILFDAGRYAEAEQACEAWAELGFADVWERCLHCTIKARALDELGRSREGLAILEDELTHQDPKYLPTADGYLADVAEISEKLGQPVDPKWRSLAEEVAEYYGVEMPKHESLGKAILELAKTIRKKDPTFQEEEGEDSDDDDDDEP
jgi:tetratricopeptide (TPR) repeat protein